MSLPKVIKQIQAYKTIENFPLQYYSYSSFVKFSTNPILFKIRYINGDHIDTKRNISGIIGNAFHSAMAAYYSLAKEDEPEAMKKGLEAGHDYLDTYPEGYIDFSSVVPTKQKASEIFAFAFNSYIQEKKHDNDEILGIEEVIEETIDLEWRGARVNLPIPLRGYLDKAVRRDGKLCIIDYKTARAFSNPDEIDGAKILQAVQYYFLAYAQYGEEPHSMIYEEVKTTKNKDGGPQVRQYEIVYKDNELFFDFYLRFYDDVTRAINGEAVFVPNINDFFDNEVAIVSYIHRLDVSEDQAKLMKEMRVSNITDLLKAKIENASNMKKLMKTAGEKFVSAKSLNYNDMLNEEKISTKLMEHGMLIKFEDKIEGYSVDLYRYNPSIGLKMSKIKGYVADIEQVVGTSGVRVLAPIPDTSLVGFEVPRKERRFPTEIPALDGFNIAIGADVTGKTYRFDIRRAPHLLIAGATGSGKSVFLNSIIKQLSQIKNVDLHLFDPKMVELSHFRGVAKEYFSDPESIYLALDDLKAEMNSRYEAMAKTGARNIEEYKGGMSYKFVVIDEFGDLILSGLKDGKTSISKEIEKTIVVLAQKARAAGIHIIIATQRPSTDIITGLIKANFPTKVAFRTAKAIDSQVLLDENGAEKLLGKGDMIFASDMGQIRLQGFNA